MTYVDLLLQNKQYLNCYNELQELETNREYCRHDMEHFMDVARIAHIINLEKDLKLDIEMIYLCALLHDIGRVDEYRTGISHDKASVALAGEILLHIGYGKEKILSIQEAISLHRKRQNISKIENEFSSLGEVIALSDQLSRKCYLCKSNDSCKWRLEEKVTRIVR